MELEVGMKVEALCNEEPYRGAWVEGIVRSINREDCKISLILKFARNDGNPLVEISVGDVRPIPPHRQLPLHSLDGVAVEANDTDCWWPGFIVKEISCEGRKLWLVSFPHTNILMAYPLSFLRPAQEWRGGNWTLVPPEQNLNVGQVIRVLSDDMSVEETKSVKDYKSSQGCNTKTGESSSAGEESKQNLVSRPPQMSLRQFKRIIRSGSTG